MKKRYLKWTAFSSALSAIPMIATLAEATNAQPEINHGEPLIQEKYLRLRIPDEQIVNGDTGQINTSFAQSHIYAPSIPKVPIYRGYGGNAYDSIERAQESFKHTVIFKDSFALNNNWEPYNFSNQEEAIQKIYSLLQPKNLSTYNLEGITYNPFNTTDKNEFISKVVQGLSHNDRYADIFRKGYRLTMDGVNYANHGFMSTLWEFAKDYREQKIESEAVTFSTTGGSNDGTRSANILKWLSNDSIINEFGFNSLNKTANSIYLQHNGQEIKGNNPANFNPIKKIIGENIKEIISKYFDYIMKDFRNNYKNHAIDPTHHFNHKSTSTVHSLSKHEKYNWAPETLTRGNALAQLMYPLDWITGDNLRKGRLHGYWTMTNPHPEATHASHGGMYYDSSSSGEHLASGAIWAPYRNGFYYGQNFYHKSLSSPSLHGNWFSDLVWHGDWIDNQHYWQTFDIANNIEINKSVTTGTHNTVTTKVKWDKLGVDQLMEIRENWLKRVIRTHIMGEENDLPQHDKALYIPKTKKYNIVSKNPADGNDNSKIISYTLTAKKWFKNVGTYPTYAQDLQIEPSFNPRGYTMYETDQRSPYYGITNTKFKDKTKKYISYDDQVIEWNGYTGDNDSFGAYFDISDFYDLNSDSNKDKEVALPFNNLNYSLTEASQRLGLFNDEGFVDLGNGFHSFSEYGTNENDATPYQKLKLDFVDKAIKLIKTKDVQVRDPRKLDTGDKGITWFNSLWIGEGNSLPTPSIQLGGGNPLPIAKKAPPSTSGTKEPTIDKNPTPTSGNKHEHDPLPEGKVWITVLDPTAVLSTIFYQTSNGENLWLENKKQIDNHYKYVYSNNMIQSLKELVNESATSEDLYLSAWRRMTGTTTNVKGLLSNFMNYLYLPDLPSGHKLNTSLVITKNIDLNTGRIVDIPLLSNANSLSSVSFAHSANEITKWKIFSGNIELKSQINSWIQDNLPKIKRMYVPSLKLASGEVFEKTITTSEEVAIDNIITQINPQMKMINRYDLGNSNLVGVLGSFDLIPEIDKVKVYFYDGKYYSNLQKLREYISETIGRTYLSIIFNS